ncbi:MAG: putative lipid II flippase FtsW [Proteobacteria bacterium]|jgi:cell division protein FtsW|nr:putative lipid II flippase FtsW [Pseudomonadota bacterium]
MKKINKLLKWFFIDSELDYDSVYDSKIIFSVIMLLAIGLMMVYSASIAYASVGSHSQYYFLIRHSISMLIGILAFMLVFSLPTSFWSKNARLVAILIALLLLAVLVPHVGRVINGSRRWIGFGGIGLQPSELSKLGIVIYLSYYLSGKTLDLHKFFYDFGPMLLVLIAYICLLLLEPDMGTATVVFIISLSMFYMSDISRKFILTLTAIGVVGFIFLVIVEPYRIRRFLGFMNPWDDALGKGYQLTHSLLAVGHGGWLGVGIGNSIEKLFYLPEAHTDFILAIIAEETGILGVSIILLLFFIIFYRGFTVIATESRYLMNRKFQSMVAQGISVWFLVQALINIGVTIGILPTKGLTLPFISYGGSSILINFIALAILLKIDYENKQIKRGVEVE